MMRLGAPIFADMMIEDGSRSEPVVTVAPQVAPTPQPTYYTAPKPTPTAPPPVIDTTPLPTTATSVATFNDNSSYASDERVAPVTAAPSPAYNDINSGGIIQGSVYPWDTTAMQQYVDTVFVQEGKPAPVTVPPVVTPESPNPITGYPGAAAVVTTATGTTPLAPTPTGGQVPTSSVAPFWTQHGKTIMVLGLLAVPLFLLGRKAR